MNTEQKIRDQEIRAKALELTLKMFSIFAAPEEATRVINDLREHGSRQHQLIDIARVFEIYIMGE